MSIHFPRRLAALLDPQVYAYHVEAVTVLETHRERPGLLNDSRRRWVASICDRTSSVSAWRGSASASVHILRSKGGCIELAEGPLGVARRRRGLVALVCGYLARPDRRPSTKDP